MTKNILTQRNNNNIQKLLDQMKKAKMEVKRDLSEGVHTVVFKGIKDHASDTEAWFIVELELDGKTYSPRWKITENTVDLIINTFGRLAMQLGFADGASIDEINTKIGAEITVYVERDTKITDYGERTFTNYKFHAPKVAADANGVGPQNEDEF
jgi:hypothetical protein